MIKIFIACTSIFFNLFLYVKCRKRKRAILRTPMKHYSFIYSILLLPTLTFAYSYTEEHLPYSDVPVTQEERVALSLLTELEVIQGNDDGTFGGTKKINRAEFVTIVMRLFEHDPAYAERVAVGCFPDVPQDVWYEHAVCDAKFHGIVEGENGFFSPTRSINYAEAMKVLVELFDLSLIRIEGDEWYEPYFRVADKEDLHLIEVADPGFFISRSQMARLAAAFVAHAEGELEEYRAAQRGEVLEQSSSSAESVSSVSSVQESSESSSSSSSSSSSVSSYTYDQHGSLDQSQDVILLGGVSPVLGAVNIFSDAQPINLTDVSIKLASAVQSVESLLVYDEYSRYLGRATLRSGSTFDLSVHKHNIEIPKRKNFSIYVRAQLKGHLAGGVSGENVQLDNITITGDGAWNNKTQSQTSTATFTVFETARSRVISIENADEDTAALVNGPGQLLGAFRFTGETGDGQADVAVTDLTFQIGAAGGVTIANVELEADGTSARQTCPIVGSTVVCSSIDSALGSFEDRSRVLRLYGDITVPSTVQTTSLQLSLNQGGSPTSAGSVTWTDGSASFTWVPFGNPVARGTYLK